MPEHIPSAPSPLLADLPDKQKFSVIGFVRAHIQEIISAQQKGYSYIEIHAKLIDQTELSFTVGTLAKYVQRVNKEQEQQLQTPGSGGFKSASLHALPLPRKTLRS